MSEQLTGPFAVAPHFDRSAPHRGPDGSPRRPAPWSTGYLGVNVVYDEDLHQYTSILRFNSLASLKAWEASGMHARWEAGIGLLVAGPAEVRRAGLEFWFRTTHHAAPLAPSRHKMAIVLVVVVTLLTYLLVPLIGHFLVDTPRIVRALAEAAIQVTLLTYVIMPRVTRLLAKWLYPAVDKGR